MKIKHVMNMHLKVTREIPLTKVERLWNGPSLRGVKPVLVCFQLFKDKEEVLRKSNMLLKVPRAVMHSGLLLCWFDWNLLNTLCEGMTYVSHLLEIGLYIGVIMG